LAEWEAFHYFEPWGSPAADDRTAVISSLIWSANSSKPVPRFFDRDPEETARKAAKEGAAMTLEAKLAAFFAPRAVAASGEPPEA